MHGVVARYTTLQYVVEWLVLVAVLSPLLQLAAMRACACVFAGEMAAPSVVETSVNPNVVFACAACFGTMMGGMIGGALVYM